MKNLINSTTPKKEKDLAQTPEWFIDSLCALLGIDFFELDVCANESTAKAGSFYSIDERGEDALKLDWDLWNWCNPPFSDIQSFVDKAVFESKRNYINTAMIMPNNPETEYARTAKCLADTIIEMPFRLQFLRPNGDTFRDRQGKPQSPQFSCLVAIFTPLGLVSPTRFMYHDFRIGFKDKRKVAA